LIVEAFKNMPHRQLVVASGGSELCSLEKLANGAPNIFFTDWVSEQELRRLVGHCKATIYIPRDEDFGRSPVQSLMAGKPVLGVREGGVLETVSHDETGILLDREPTPRDIIDGIALIDQKQWRINVDAVHTANHCDFINIIRQNLRSEV
jgi:glycosyltransferase involved in cell wall biosynthesis